MTEKVPRQETSLDLEATLASNRKTSFSGDVMRLTSGTVFAQGLLVLAAPFLTRLYSPEAFGVAALFISITSIITAIACMRYELAIMLPKSDKEAANLLGVSLLFAVIISLFTIPAVLLGGEGFLVLLKAPNLIPYLWLFPISVFIGGVFLALNYWNSRTKHFTRLSIARVTASIVTVTSQLGAGCAGYDRGASLIGSHVAGQAVSTTVLGSRIWRKDKEILLKSINFRNMLEIIKRYRKFPLYSSWSAVLNSISWQIPAFLLSFFFSPIVLGYYALGLRIIKMPMHLIGRSIGQVFFQRASEAKSQGKLASLVEATFYKLALICMFPMAMLLVAGRDIFALVFGSNWAEAGVYTQILSVWAFFWFISSPMSTLFSVMERQELGLKINSMIFLSRFISLVIGGLLGSARVSLALFSLSGVFCYGYLNFLTMRLSGISLTRQLKICVQILGPVVCIIAIQFAVMRLNDSSLTRVFIAVFLSLIYFLFLLLFRREALMGLRKG